MKTALVTGGTAGVGYSIVRALVRDGAFVHFIGTNVEKGQRIEAELNARGPTSRFVQLDLSSLGDVQQFARRFASEQTSLDVLANVAGVMLATRQQTDDGFEKTFAIAHLAAFVLCQELSPLLAEAPRGRIVNVSGAPAQLLNARLDFDDLQLERSYSLMKAAINAVHAKTVMTEILAERLASEGIDVNAFHPGAVKSDLFRHMKPPMSWAFGFARLFMSSDSKAGIHAATSDELNTVTGQLFVGLKARNLEFERTYKDRLWNVTEELVAAATPNPLRHL